MKTWVRVILAIIVVLLVLLNLYGWLIHSGGFCTLMHCFCTDSGERECNRCGKTQTYLLTGLFNIYSSCSGKEILTCSNGELVDERIDYECDLKWNVLFVYP